MIIGYARTSTTEQAAGLEAQDRELQMAGCDLIVAEQASAVGERPELENTLATLKRGDVLVVTKLDRLARSVAHFGQIVDELKERGAELRILGLGLDTSTPVGKLVLNMLASVAQFEREVMLERQREGIEAAKKAGKYCGRKTEHDPLELRAAVQHREHIRDVSRCRAVREVAAEFGCSERTVYRALEG